MSRLITSDFLNVKNGNLLFNCFFNCRDNVVDLFNGDIWKFEDDSIKYRNKIIITIPLDEFGEAVEEQPELIFYNYKFDDQDQRRIREQLLIRIKYRFPTYHITTVDILSE